MELNEVEAGGGWAPQACTLPTAERPLRVAEFDALFAEAVRSVERVEPGRVRLGLEATPLTAGRAAELVVAETGCCSFFTFTLTATGGQLWLEVTVPAAHIEVLDALSARATGRSGMSGLRSGQVAQAAGVNLQTLRYYERRGLLAEPERTLGGHRVYQPEAVRVLRVIKTAQRLEFTLEEVAGLLAAGRHRHRNGQSEDPGLQARARAKLADVQARIADLTVIADTLHAALAAGCDDLVACSAAPGCPLPFADLADAHPATTADCGGRV